MNANVQSAAVVAGIFLLLLAVAVLYVGGEGAFYYVWEDDHFPQGTAYRTLYAPLDLLSDQYPAIYGYRESLAEEWAELSGPPRMVFVGPEYPCICVCQ